MRKVLIIGFILLAVVLRFLWLDKVPNAIGGDELTYTVVARAMAINWSDIVGKWNPFSIFAFRYPFGDGQAELGYFLVYPFVLTGFSMLNAKLIFALLGVCSVVLIYLITRRLSDEKTATIAGFIAAINPWLIIDNRTGYEMGLAVFFTLLSFYILLIAKNWKILAAIPFLFAIFYSYIAVKLIFIPLVFLLLVFVYLKNGRRFLKQYSLVFAACLALVIFFVFMLKSSTNATRTGEIFTPSNPEVRRLVNEARQTTIQSPITNVFENKITVYSSFLTNKFFNIFSTDYLFAHSDGFVGIENHGLLYYLDALFILLGIVFLALKNRVLLIFLLTGAAISVLPHVFHKARLDNFTPHIVLLFPFLIILISFGISGLSTIFKKSYINKLILAIIGVLYLVSLLNFLNIYFFQYPLKGNSDFQVRLLSKYVQIAEKQNGKVVVYTNRAFDLFKKHLFYSNAYDKKSFNEIKRAVNNKKHLLGHVEFKDCDVRVDFVKEKAISIIDSQCGVLFHPAKHLTIPLLIDGGERFSIYNDSVCRNYELKSYPSNLKIDDFGIEGLTKERFCKIFITSNNPF
jgi:4-amino-4-deoxy-L-arabinose transferase-like glycosyltransferase